MGICIIISQRNFDAYVYFNLILQYNKTHSQFPLINILVKHHKNQCYAKTSNYVKNKNLLVIDGFLF